MANNITYEIDLKVNSQEALESVSDFKKDVDDKLSTIDPVQSYLEGVNQTIQTLSTGLGQNDPFRSFANSAAAATSALSLMRKTLSSLSSTLDFDKISNGMTRMFESSYRTMISSVNEINNSMLKGFNPNSKSTTPTNAERLLNYENSLRIATATGGSAARDAIRLMRIARNNKTGLSSEQIDTIVPALNSIVRSNVDEYTRVNKATPRLSELAKYIAGTDIFKQTATRGIKGYNPTDSQLEALAESLIISTRSHSYRDNNELIRAAGIKAAKHNFVVDQLPERFREAFLNYGAPAVQGQNGSEAASRKIYGEYRKLVRNGNQQAIRYGLDVGLIRAQNGRYIFSSKPNMAQMNTMAGMATRAAYEAKASLPYFHINPTGQLETDKLLNRQNNVFNDALELMEILNKDRRIAPNIYGYVKNGTPYADIKNNPLFTFSKVGSDYRKFNSKSPKIKTLGVNDQFVVPKTSLDENGELIWRDPSWKKEGGAQEKKDDQFATIGSSAFTYLLNMGGNNTYGYGRNEQGESIYQTPKVIRLNTSHLYKQVKEKNGTRMIIDPEKQKEAEEIEKIFARKKTLEYGAPGSKNKTRYIAAFGDADSITLIQQGSKTGLDAQGNYEVGTYNGIVRRFSDLGMANPFNNMNTGGLFRSGDYENAAKMIDLSRKKATPGRQYSLMGFNNIGKTNGNIDFNTPTMAMVDFESLYDYLGVAPADSRNRQSRRIDGVSFFDPSVLGVNAQMRSAIVGKFMGQRMDWRKLLLGSHLLSDAYKNGTNRGLLTRNDNNILPGYESEGGYSFYMPQIGLKEVQADWLSKGLGRKQGKAISLFDTLDEAGNIKELGLISEMNRLQEIVDTQTKQNKGTPVSTNESKLLDRIRDTYFYDIMSKKYQALMTESTVKNNDKFRIISKKAFDKGGLFEKEGAGAWARDLGNGTVELTADQQRRYFEKATEMTGGMWIARTGYDFRTDKNYIPESLAAAMGVNTGELKEKSIENYNEYIHRMQTDKNARINFLKSTPMGRRIVEEGQWDSSSAKSLIESHINEMRTKKDKGDLFLPEMGIDQLLTGVMPGNVFGDIFEAGFGVRVKDNNKYRKLFNYSDDQDRVFMRTISESDSKAVKHNAQIAKLMLSRLPAGPGEYSVKTQNIGNYAAIKKAMDAIGADYDDTIFTDPALQYTLMTGDYDGDTAWVLRGLSDNAFERMEAIQQHVQNARAEIQAKLKVAPKGEKRKLENDLKAFTNFGADHFTAQIGMGQSTAAIRNALEDIDSDDPEKWLAIAEAIEAYDLNTSEAMKQGKIVQLGSHADKYAKEGATFRRFINQINALSNGSEDANPNIFTTRLPEIKDEATLFDVAANFRGKRNGDDVGRRFASGLNDWLFQQYGYSDSYEARAARYYGDLFKNITGGIKLVDVNDISQGRKIAIDWRRQLESRRKAGDVDEAFLEEESKLNSFVRRLQQAEESGSLYEDFQTRITDLQGKRERLIAQGVSVDSKDVRAIDNRINYLNDLVSPLTKPFEVAKKEYEALKQSEDKEVLERIKSNKELAEKHGVKLDVDTEAILAPILGRKQEDVAAVNWSDNTPWTYEELRKAGFKMQGIQKYNVISGQTAKLPINDVPFNPWPHKDADIKEKRISTLAKELDKDEKWIKRFEDSPAALMGSTRHEAFAKAIELIAQGKTADVTSIYESMLNSEGKGEGKLGFRFKDGLGLSLERDDTTGKYTVKGASANITEGVNKALGTFVPNKTGTGGQYVGGTLSAFINSFVLGKKVANVEGYNLDDKGQRINDGTDYAGFNGRGGSIMRKTIVGKDGKTYVKQGTFAPDLIMENANNTFSMYDYKSGMEGAFDSLVQMAVYAKDIQEKATAYTKESDPNERNRVYNEIKQNGWLKYIDEKTGKLKFQDFRAFDTLTGDLYTWKFDENAVEEISKGYDAALSEHFTGSEEDRAKAIELLKSKVAEKYGGGMQKAAPMSTRQVIKEINIGKATGNGDWYNDYVADKFGKDEETFKEINTAAYKTKRMYSNEPVAGYSKFAGMRRELEATLDDDVLKTLEEEAEKIEDPGKKASALATIVKLQTDKSRARTNLNEAEMLAVQNGFSDINKYIAEQFYGVKDNKATTAFDAIQNRILNASAEREALKQNKELFDNGQWTELAKSGGYDKLYEQSLKDEQATLAEFKKQLPEMQKISIRDNNDKLTELLSETKESTPEESIQAFYDKKYKAIEQYIKQQNADIESFNKKLNQVDKNGNLVLAQGSVERKFFEDLKANALDNQNSALNALQDKYAIRASAQREYEKSIGLTNGEKTKTKATLQREYLDSIKKEYEESTALIDPKQISALKANKTKAERGIIKAKTAEEYQAEIDERFARQAAAKAKMDEYDQMTKQHGITEETEKLQKEIDKNNAQRLFTGTTLTRDEMIQRSFLSKQLAANQYRATLSPKELAEFDKTYTPDMLKQQATEEVENSLLTSRYQTTVGAEQLLGQLRRVSHSTEYEAAQLAEQRRAKEAQVQAERQAEAERRAKEEQAKREEEERRKQEQDRLAQEEEQRRQQAEADKKQREENEASARREEAGKQTAALQQDAIRKAEEDKTKAQVSADNAALRRTNKINRRRELVSKAQGLLNQADQLDLTTPEMKQIDEASYNERRKAIDNASTTAVENYNKAEIATYEKENQTKQDARIEYENALAETRAKRIPLEMQKFVAETQLRGIEANAPVLETLDPKYQARIDELRANAEPGGAIDQAYKTKLDAVVAENPELQREFTQLEDAANARGYNPRREFRAAYKEYKKEKERIAAEREELKTADTQPLKDHIERIKTAAETKLKDLKEPVKEDYIRRGTEADEAKAEAERKAKERYDDDIRKAKEQEAKGTDAGRESGTYFRKRAEEDYETAKNKISAMPTSKTYEDKYLEDKQRYDITTEEIKNKATSEIERATLTWNSTAVTEARQKKIADKAKILDLQEQGNEMVFESAKKDFNTKMGVIRKDLDYEKDSASASFTSTQKDAAEKEKRKALEDNAEALRRAEEEKAQAEKDLEERNKQAQADHAAKVAAAQSRVQGIQGQLDILDAADTAAETRYKGTVAAAAATREQEVKAAGDARDAVLREAIEQGDQLDAEHNAEEEQNKRDFRRAQARHTLKLGVHKLAEGISTFLSGREDKLANQAEQVERDRRDQEEAILGQYDASVAQAGRLSVLPSEVQPSGGQQPEVTVTGAQSITVDAAGASQKIEDTLQRQTDNPRVEGGQSPTIQPPAGGEPPSEQPSNQPSNFEQSGFVPHVTELTAAQENQAAHNTQMARHSVKQRIREFEALGADITPYEQSLLNELKTYDNDPAYWGSYKEQQEKDMLANRQLFELHTNQGIRDNQFRNEMSTRGLERQLKQQKRNRIPPRGRFGSSFYQLQSVRNQLTDKRDQLEHDSQKAAVAKKEAEIKYKALSETDKKGKEGQQLQADIQKANDSLNSYDEQMKDVNKQLKTFNPVANTAAAGFNAISGSVSMLLHRFGRQMFMKALNEAKRFVKEFNATMTEIQMITLKSDDQMSKLGDGLIQKAKTLKISISEISQSAATLYRQGLSDQEVNERLDVVSKFSKVSGTKVGDATKLITVAMNTGLVTDPKVAADIVTALGDNAATNAAQIEKGVEKAGAAAAADGTTFAQLASMLTAITSTTQIGGNVAGRTLNTIFGRMNKIGTNELIYDENGHAISGSAVAKLLKAQGIDMYDENGKKRSSYDTLYALSQKWDTMSDAEQQQIATAIAGTRQYSNFAAIMQGMSEGKVDEYMELASGAEGTTDKKFDIYTQSLQASLTELKNTFDELVNTLVDTGALQDFLKFITNAIQGVTNLTKNLGGLKGVLSALLPVLASIVTIKLGLSLGGLAGVGIAAAGLVGLGFSVNRLSSIGAAHTTTAVEKEEEVQKTNKATIDRMKSRYDRMVELKDKGKDRTDAEESEYQIMIESYAKLNGISKEAVAGTTGLVKAIDSLGKSADKTADSVGTFEDEVVKAEKKRIEQSEVSNFYSEMGTSAGAIAEETETAVTTRNDNASINTEALMDTGYSGTKGKDLTGFTRDESGHIGLSDTFWDYLNETPNNRDKVAQLYYDAYKLGAFDGVDFSEIDKEQGTSDRNLDYWKRFVNYNSGVAGMNVSQEDQDKYKNVASIIQTPFETWLSAEAAGQGTDQQTRRDALTTSISSRLEGKVPESIRAVLANTLVDNIMKKANGGPITEELVMDAYKEAFNSGNVSLEDLSWDNVSKYAMSYLAKNRVSTSAVDRYKYDLDEGDYYVDESGKKYTYEEAKALREKERTGNTRVFITDSTNGNIVQTKEIPEGKTVEDVIAESPWVGYYNQAGNQVGYNYMARQANGKSTITVNGTQVSTDNLDQAAYETLFKQGYGYVAGGQLFASEEQANAYMQEQGLEGEAQKVEELTFKGMNEAVDNINGIVLQIDDETDNLTNVTQHAFNVTEDFVDGWEGYSKKLTAVTAGVNKAATAAVQTYETKNATGIGMDIIYRAMSDSNASWNQEGLTDVQRLNLFSDWADQNGVDMSIISQSPEFGEIFTHTKYSDKEHKYISAGEGTFDALRRAAAKNSSSYGPEALTMSQKGELANEALDILANGGYVSEKVKEAAYQQVFVEQTKDLASLPESIRQQIIAQRKNAGLIRYKNGEVLTDEQKGAVKEIVGEDLTNKYFSGNASKEVKDYVERRVQNAAQGISGLTAADKLAGIRDIAKLSRPEDWRNFDQTVAAQYLGNWENREEYFALKGKDKLTDAEKERLTTLNQEFENLQKNAEIDIDLQGTKALEEAGKLTSGLTSDIQKLQKGGKIALEVTMKYTTEAFESGQQMAALYNGTISEQDEAAMKILGGMSREQFYQDREGNIAKAKRINTINRTQKAKDYTALYNASGITEQDRQDINTAATSAGYEQVITYGPNGRTVTYVDTRTPELARADAFAGQTAKYTESELATARQRILRGENLEETNYGLYSAAASGMGYYGYEYMRQLWASQHSGGAAPSAELQQRAMAEAELAAKEEREKEELELLRLGTTTGGGALAYQQAKYNQDNKAAIAATSIFETLGKIDPKSANGWVELANSVNGSQASNWKELINSSADVAKKLTDMGVTIDENGKIDFSGVEKAGYSLEDVLGVLSKSASDASDSLRNLTEVLTPEETKERAELYMQGKYPDEEQGFAALRSLVGNDDIANLIRNNVLEYNGNLKDWQTDRDKLIALRGNNTQSSTFDYYQRLIDEHDANRPVFNPDAWKEKVDDSLLPYAEKYINNGLNGFGLTDTDKYQGLLMVQQAANNGTLHQLMNKDNLGLVKDWTSNIEGFNTWAAVVKDMETTFKDTKDPVERLDKALAKNNVTKEQFNTIGNKMKKTLKEMSAGLHNTGTEAKDASDGLNSFRQNMQNINDNQASRNKFRNGGKIDEATKDYIVSLGFDKYDYKKKDKRQAILDAMAINEAAERETLQNEINDTFAGLSSEVSTYFDGQTIKLEDGTTIYVDPNVGVEMDTSQVLTQLDSVLTDTQKEMLKAIMASGVSMTWKIQNNGSGGVDIIPQVSNLGSGYRSANKTPSNKSSKSKTDQLIEGQGHYIKAREHDVKMAETYTSHLENLGDYAGAIKGVETQIVTQKRLYNQYSANADALRKQLSTLKTGTEEWYKCREAIQQAEESMAGIENTISQLESKIAELVKKMHDLENSVLDYKSSILSTRSQRYQTVDDFNSYLASVQAEIDQVDEKIEAWKRQNEEDRARMRAAQGRDQSGAAMEYAQAIMEREQQIAQAELERIQKQQERNLAIIARTGTLLERTIASRTSRANIASAFAGYYQNREDFGNYIRMLTVQNSQLQAQTGYYQNAIKEQQKLMAQYKTGSVEWLAARENVMAYTEALANLVVQIDENNRAAQEAKITAVQTNAEFDNSFAQHDYNIYSAREQQYETEQDYQGAIRTTEGMLVSSQTQLARKRKELEEYIDLLNSGDITDPEAYKKLIQIVQQTTENINELEISVQSLKDKMAEFKFEDLVQGLSEADTLTNHRIQMIQYEETKYKNDDQYTNYNTMIGYENSELEARKGLYEDVLPKLHEQLQEAEAANNKPLYDKIAEKIRQAEEEIAKINGQIESNNKLIDDNKKKIIELQKTVENAIDNEIKNRIKLERDMLDGTVANENTILSVIRKRYQDEWALVKKDIAAKKKALSQEKNLINDRLNARKKAIDAEDKYARLAELERQLAIISADPTRTKETKQIQKERDDLLKDISMSKAEDHANAEMSAIDDQLEALSEYETAYEATLNEWLEDANNFSDEMAKVLGGTFEEYVAWLKENEEAYKLSSDATRKQMEEGWKDSWNKMTGYVETYWEQVAEIMKSEESFVEFLKKSQQYQTESEIGKFNLERYTYRQMYQAFFNSTLDNATFSHEDETYNGQRRSEIDSYIELINAAGITLENVREFLSNLDADEATIAAIMATLTGTDYTAEDAAADPYAGSAVQSAEATYLQSIATDSSQLTKLVQSIRTALEDIKNKPTSTPVININVDGGSGGSSGGGNGGTNNYGVGDDGGVYKKYGWYYESMNGTKKSSSKAWTSESAALSAGYADRKKYIDNYMSGGHTASEISKFNSMLGDVHFYRKGGLADYTGLAMVHGTPSDPEAFLSSMDTKLMRSFLNAFDYVSTGHFLSPTSDMFSGSTNVGDIHITINQAELKKDADYEDVARRIGKAFTREMSKSGLNLSAYSF